MTGYEFNYRQGLTFLPHWARGVDVFYNMTSQRLDGSSVADFSNFVRRNDNYGVTLSRPKFTVRLDARIMPPLSVVAWESRSRDGARCELRPYPAQ
mgnify:CR=1 FL=1